MSSVTVEPVRADHLPVVLPWWPAHGIDTPLEKYLPPVGFVASDEAGPVAACWLGEKVGVPAGTVEWMVTRPGLTLGQARHAGRMVLDAIETEARARGIAILYSEAYRPQMMREVRACGFEPFAQGVVHFVKELCSTSPLSRP
jgi:hypothetical protein